MDQNQRTNLKNRLRTEISSFSLDKDDMRKFCDLLQERSSSAAEIEVTKFNRGDMDEEKYQEAIKLLRECFDLRVTVTGVNGEELYGTIDEVFDSVNFSDNVKSLYVNNDSVLRAVHNYYPLNSFQVFLDFSKPKIFDFSFMPNQGTPNESNYEVQGYDATWVNGVFSEITKFIKQRSSTLSIVHSHSIYDLLLWFLGFPFAFWACLKMSTYIEYVSTKTNIFVESALYFYCFVAVLFIFRVLFHYLRWICPLVEYKPKDSNINTHRTVLGMLLVGIIGTFITDIIKALF